MSKRLIGVIEGNSSQEGNAKNVNTLLNKENLKCMIKVILNEEFTKQGQNITKLINGNFQTTMAELKKSQDDIKELKNEINDFKASLQFTENELKEKIQSLAKKHENICVKVEEVYDTQIDPEFVHDKLLDLEDRSKRNNLRIYGVIETNDETLEKCEEHVEQVFSEKLGLKNIRVERAHCVKRRKGDKKTKQNRAIICNLLSFKEKRLVMNNANKLKGTHFYR